MSVTQDALDLIGQLAHEIGHKAAGTKQEERTKIEGASLLIEKLARGDELTAEEQQKADGFLKH